MADRPPEFIASWLKDNMHRMDGPEQYLGTEPGAVRKSWDSASVRWLMAASWPYMQAAGNLSIPAVYDAVNKGREDFLCDRFYLPATPRDLGLLERGGIPVFGIESRHQLRDFDVVGTSISYTVLFMNFCRLLTLSGVPLRRKDRARNRGDYPMVLVGGQAYCAPGFMDPVVDAVFLGEVEDEPGNGGISSVNEKISAFKTEGSWKEDRLYCYERLAAEFNYLYFPQFTEVEYDYQDRGLPHASKQVKAIRPKLPGMKYPFRGRKVRNLDNVSLITSAPILFSDPGMGAGDVEAQRGCPAWSIPQDALVEVAGHGVVPFAQVRAGDSIRIGSVYRRVAAVALHGEKYTIRVQTRQGHVLECTPEHEVYAVRGPVPESARSKRGWLDSAPRVWVHAEELREGDYLLRTVGGVSWPAWSVEIVHPELEYRVGRGRALRFYETLFPEEVTEEVGWFLGMVTGDCYIRSNQLEFRLERSADRVRAKLREVVKALFDVDLTEYPAPDGESIHCNLNSARLVRWLSSNFGIRDTISRKRVPAVIFQSPRDVVAAYLSALYDCNGTALIPKSESSSVSIRYVVYAEAQVREVSELLRMLGLPSAVRSEERILARDGSPARRTSIKWECRTTAADTCEAYSWLMSLEDFKGRHLDWFRPPVHLERCTAQGGLQYLAVSGSVPARVTAVMDVDVPGPQAFNVSGIYVHNCSFCRLSWVTKPYRQESTDNTVRRAKEWRRNMGSLEMSPFGPDFPMGTNKKELLARLMEEVSDEVDTSSMRIDDYIGDTGYSMLMAVGGQDSITLGLEGNSQRMRDLAGKGISDADVEEAVTRAIRAGIRKIKLYMITNWPGEEEGDVRRIIDLGRRLADIRESFGEAARGVRIQFSWTPLLIEAQTPLQWFAPTPPDYHLQEALVTLRDEYRIDVKLGTKAQPSKLAFFQACQRASRDAGEAIVDVIEELGTASWGGFAKDMKERLDAALVKHGFLNGLEDLFGERYSNDLFGWEHIDTGVSKSLMWSAYRQMVEFLEGTDAESYDQQFDAAYRGAEWIARCDEKCSGKACGCCDKEDLELRREYVQYKDRDLEEKPVQPLDQTTVAFMVRSRVVRPEKYRYVTDDSYRFIIRRAAYRARDESGDRYPYIAKRTVRLASESVKYRDRSAGTDYFEFGMTRPLGELNLNLYMGTLGRHLSPWLELDSWGYFPADGKMPSSPVSLWELEVAESEETLNTAFRRWDEAEEVPVLLRSETFYAGAQQQEADAKKHVSDFWLVRDGSRLVLRMLLTGQLGPYQAHAVLLGKASWIEAAARTAFRLDFFGAVSTLQGSLLSPVCSGCGAAVPAGLLGTVFDMEYCPRCKDEASGKVAGALGVQELSLGVQGESADARFLCTVTTECPRCTGRISGTSSMLRSRMLSSAIWRLRKKKRTGPAPGSACATRRARRDAETGPGVEGGPPGGLDVLAVGV